MSDMGWTNHISNVEEMEYEKWGFCLICGKEIQDDQEETEVSNGPGQPAIGGAHVECPDYDSSNDSQVIEDRDNGHFDYPDFVE